MTEVIEHKCPKCGSNMRFDVGSQKVICPYCKGEFSADALTEDLDLSDSGLASDAGEEWGSDIEGMAEYHCNSCGAAIYTDENTSATICPYCSNAVILKGRLSGTLKPNKVLPFKKTKDEALSALRERCMSNRFIKKGFLDEQKLEEIKGLYVPFWLYDAEIHADVEYHCTETHGDKDHRTTDHYCVKRSGDVAFDRIPVDGSIKMPDELMESIQPFDYGEAENFRTGYLSGYVAEKYDLDQEGARPRAAQRIREGAAEAFRTTIHGYDTTKVVSSSYTVKKSNVEYVMYPVWLMNLSWNNEMYRFAMNGQTGKTVGNLPVNYGALYSVSAAIFLAIAGILAAVFFCLDGSFSIGSTIIALVIGFIPGALFYYGNINQLKNVKFTYGASDYLRPGSMNITSKSDTHLY